MEELKRKLIEEILKLEKRNVLKVDRKQTKIVSIYVELSDVLEKIEKIL